MRFAILCLATVVLLNDLGASALESQNRKPDPGLSVNTFQAVSCYSLTMENQLNPSYSRDELVAHQEALGNLKGMMEVLTNDIDEFVEMAMMPNQIVPFSATRAYVRAVFALVEGVSFGFRQVAVKLPQADHCLTQAELAILNEESYGLKDNGQVSTTTRFLKVQAGTRFTFGICRRVYDIKPEIDYGARGWNSFTQSIKIRDRFSILRVLNH